jgi:hypothetical protein
MKPQTDKRPWWRDLSLVQLDRRVRELPTSNLECLYSDLRRSVDSCTRHLSDSDTQRQRRTRAALKHLSARMALTWDELERRERREGGAA